MTMHRLFAGVAMSVCGFAFVATGCSQAGSDALLPGGGPSESLSGATHATGHIMPKLRAGQKPKVKTYASGVAHLSYNGGPVLSNAKIVTVYWGQIDNTAQLNSFFQTITRSAYFDWLSEYNTPTQHIGEGSFGSAVNVAAPPSRIDDSQIQQQLDTLVRNGTLPPPDANTLYMNYFQRGTSITMGTDTSCVQFCAYHGSVQGTGGLIYYGVIPYLGDACAGGCGQADIFSNTTEVSSHEMIEAVTDPDVGRGNLAWYDQQNGEIGDICNGEAGSVSGFAIQLEWSNALGSCIATNGNAPPPQDAGAPPPQDAGAPPPQDAGAPPPQDSGLPPPPPPQDAGGGTCDSEQEPNDVIQYADTLGTCITGAIDPSDDVDWSTWSVGAAGVSYDLSLSATGDAQIALYKDIGDGNFYQVTGTSPTEIARTSNGAGTYYVVVWSPSGTTQGYTLTLRR